MNDSATGIKAESKPTLNVLTKTARYTETGLKLLSTFKKTDDGTYVISDDKIGALYTILSAESQFLQSEYAEQVVVKGSFDDKTARLFRSLESNNAVFTDQALGNVRKAAELAAVSSRPTNRQGRGQRGQRFNIGQSPWEDEGPTSTSFNGQPVSLANHTLIKSDHCVLV